MGAKASHELATFDLLWLTVFLILPRDCAQLAQLYPPNICIHCTTTAVLIDLNCDRVGHLRRVNYRL